MASLSKPWPPLRGQDPPGRRSGAKAIEHGCGTYFVRAYDLMEDLRKARIEHNLDRRMKAAIPSPARPQVLGTAHLGRTGCRTHNSSCSPEAPKVQ